MPKPIPIYRSHDKTSQADTCGPLVDAVGRGKVRLEGLVHGHYPGRPLPKDALPEVKSVGYWDAGDDQDWGLPWHRNEGVEITLLDSGRLEFGVDEGEYVLRPGDMTITRPWQRHRVGNPHISAGRLIFLILDVGIRRPHQSWKWPPWLVLRRPDLDELTNMLRQNEQPVWKVPLEMRRCFQAVAHAVESDRKGSSVSRLAVKINELFVLLLDLFRHYEIRLDESLWSSRRTVELFLADLRAHPEHLALEWTVQGMADSCRLGVTQFFHHVRALTNTTPMHYLNNCRLDLGARLLRDHPGKNITDISLTCGFSSSQYFATAFSRRFGCPPRDYRAGSCGFEVGKAAAARYSIQQR